MTHIEHSNSIKIEGIPRSILKTKRTWHVRKGEKVTCKRQKLILGVRAVSFRVFRIARYYNVSNSTFSNII